MGRKELQRQKGITPWVERDNPMGGKGQPHRQKGTIPEAERDNPMGRKEQLQRQKGTTPWAERDNPMGRKRQPHGQNGTTPWAERDNPMGRKGQPHRQKETTRCSFSHLSNTDPVGVPKTGVEVGDRGKFSAVWFHCPLLGRCRPPPHPAGSSHSAVCRQACLLPCEPEGRHSAVERNYNMWETVNIMHSNEWKTASFIRQFLFYFWFQVCLLKAGYNIQKERGGVGGGVRIYILKLKNYSGYFFNSQFSWPTWQIYESESLSYATSCLTFPSLEH